MNKCKKVFGAGPRGILISLAMWMLTWWLESVVSLPHITSNVGVRWVVFSLSIVGAILLAIWSFKSLPVSVRGKALVITGAYRYFRHPLYATFLSCSNVGLAVLLNNWIYILWAILLHGVWHWNVGSEEKQMRHLFPRDYDLYCQRTGRFIPRIGCFFWQWKKS